MDVRGKPDTNVIKELVRALINPDDMPEIIRLPASDVMLSEDTIAHAVVSATDVMIEHFRRVSPMFASPETNTVWLPIAMTVLSMTARSGASNFVDQFASIAVEQLITGLKEKRRDSGG